jgi:F5/8 type C domain.
MKRIFWMVIPAMILALILAAPAGAETIADGDTLVTIVKAPAQEKAERPACFPDPSANFVPLPETENLAEGKPVQASAHNDVYISGYLNDGSTSTYWESRDFPAEVTVDLQGTHTVSVVAFCLNPAAIWEPRTQEIAVLLSTDGENYTEVSPAAAYSFDAETGNRVRIDIEPAEAAYVRVIISSNTASPAHAKGAQLAEICVYGE